MPDKEIFVLKIVWRKSIASLHHLTQAVQRANLQRTAGDPTWVILSFEIFEPKQKLSCTFKLSIAIDYQLWCQKSHVTCENWW